MRICVRIGAVAPPSGGSSKLPGRTITSPRRRSPGTWACPQSSRGHRQANAPIRPEVVPRGLLATSTGRTSAGRASVASAARQSASDGALDGKVLVVGATGRVGGMVVRRLCEEGSQVVAMVRDKESSAGRELAGLPYPNLQVVVGDLNNSQPELEALLEGCSVCVTTSGAERRSNMLDLLPGTPKDLTHPYFVNYKGIETLCAAMKAQGCRRIVRITSSGQGKSAFYPFSVLLNLVLSMSVKWQNRGEKAIRDSGLEYVIIRPPALTDAAGGRPKDFHLRLSDQGEAGSGEIRISREDVADLICETHTSPRCANTTLTCKWGKGPGPQAWAPLIDSVRPDVTKETALKPFTLANTIYLVVAGGVLLAFVKAAGTLVSYFI